MSKRDDLATAAAPNTSASRLPSLIGSPWSEVRAAVASHPRLPAYALHRLCLDSDDDVSVAACLVLAHGSEDDIRAALAYDPVLARAVLKASLAYDRPTNGFAMPQADFERVMAALGMATLTKDLAGMPRDWLVAVTGLT